MRVGRHRLNGEDDGIEPDLDPRTVEKATVSRKAQVSSCSFVAVPARSAALI